MHPAAAYEADPLELRQHTIEQLRMATVQAWAERIGPDAGHMQRWVFGLADLAPQDVQCRHGLAADGDGSPVIIHGRMQYWVPQGGGEPVQLPPSELAGL